MKAIWIDPGETVGWATFDVTTPHDGNDGHHPPTIRPLDWGNTKLRTFAMRLLETAANYDVIGFETYAIRPDKLREHAGSTVPTLQLVGMIRQAAWAAQDKRVDGFPLIEEQSPNDKTAGLGAMRLHFEPGVQDAINEALKGPHDSGHYGDALLHGACWFHRKFYGGPSWENRFA